MLRHNAALATVPPARAPAAGLDACYEHCAGIVRAHSKSFFLSCRFLPRAKQRAVWAVYAFCRTADDIVDAGAATGDILSAIDAWEAQLRAAYAGRARGPVFVALADAAARFAVPLEAALDLLRGVRMDVTVSRYATYDDLRAYCYLVASTVGLLVTPILGALDAAAATYAVTLGQAMQLTNILRDVGEDARRGRIYLPADELARFRYTEADLSAGVVDERFVALMRFQIARARALYRDAEPGIRRLEPESRYAVHVALDLYRGILGEIETNRYDVFGRRAVVPLGTKLRTAVALRFGMRKA